jgi:hypothetical protein
MLCLVMTEGHIFSLTLNLKNCTYTNIDDGMPLNNRRHEI